VTVDDEDIQANLRGWQDTIGYVPQSIYLCDDSIRRNVAFGVPEADIDDDAVRRALKAAQLDAFVEGLPAGADTFVGELGSRLSGGQKQRIGIARALYHDPQVLVLDEATSALDAETEKEVMAAVNSLHGAKTLIIVAHRLTTVADCDLIYRLDKGRVVQSGTAAEVIST
jgi:ABC-type multidrug transport system fused ATPase/permease subunit